MQLQKVHEGVFVIDNFFNDQECTEFIQRINEDELKENRMFSHTCDFYNNKQIDNDVAQFLWNRIMQYFPRKYTDLKGIQWLAIKPSHFVATTHYKKSQHFGLHTDTGIIDKDDSHVRSKFTTLIYLNDNYENGQTCFFDDNFKHTVTIQPKKGRILIFDIDLWHLAEPIANGEKYWIGVELMFRLNLHKNT